MYWSNYILRLLSKNRGGRSCAVFQAAHSGMYGNTNDDQGNLHPDNRGSKQVRPGYVSWFYQEMCGVVGDGGAGGRKKAY
jgi:hypothetical protein